MITPGLIFGDDKKYWRETSPAPLNIKDFHRKLFLKELKKLEFNSVLEVGCGSGVNLELINKKFPKVSLAGIDINEEAVDNAKELLPEALMSIGDILTLPYEDKTFDVVLADAVLMYILPEEIEQVASEMKRIARKYIIVCDWHSDKENELGTIGCGHWVRNYEKLFGKSKLIKLSNWGGGWDTYGNIIIYNNGKK
jgi:ubiquinone/menaquinone biosynthesis C-methylase UbiE